MSVTYGFFNAVESGGVYDRQYNADQMSEYFNGLVSNGVYLNVGDAFKVVASGDGLSVNVKTGRAIIDCKWVKNDGIETVVLNPADASKPRYTAITLRLSYSDRLISLGFHDGSPATSPTKPTPLRTAESYELILAYVLVPAGATTISQAQIEDTRASKSLCGWVSGLIDQVDTGTLFDQFNAAYQSMLQQMTRWQAQQQAQYEEWFASLTSTLTVGAIDQEFTKTVTFPANSGSGKSVFLGDIEGYTYKDGDIIMVYINGLVGIEGIDYDMVMMSDQPNVVFRTLNVRSNPCVVFVRILQSKASSGGGGGNSEAIGLTYGNPMISGTDNADYTTNPQFTNIGG